MLLVVVMGVSVRRGLLNWQIVAERTNSGLANYLYLMH